MIGSIRLFHDSMDTPETVDQVVVCAFVSDEQKQFFADTLEARA